MSREQMAKIFKRLRMRSGLTAREVGEAVGKSDKTVSAWETGRGQPDLDTLLLLCDLYQVEDIRDAFSPGKPVPQGETREWLLAQGYRQLDRHGRELVDLVLAKELERCREESAAKIAARDGGVRQARREELEDMEAVYQKLLLPHLGKEGN